MSERLSTELETAYDPPKIEGYWYKWWEDKGLFRPLSDVDPEKAKGREPFVIMMPPPNVTGSLHLGHALTVAVQDTVIRWHRMKGDNTLYLPGLDHAGIATQVVVEKKLKAEEGKTRHDYTREEFVKRVWQWKQEYGDRICLQLRRTACSADWSRLAFSMDDERSAATTEAFCRLADSKKIYRAKRLINWCPTLRSAISDIEVEYVDVENGTRLRVPGYEKTIELGYLLHFAYKIADSETDEELVVATTRPETILGDTAVAINSQDPRYTKFHGKRVKCPFRDETIPIILDDKLVDINFGTGVVKVTPAHDPNDFESGQRHSLPQINIFTEDGNINENGAPFVGMKRLECRLAIIKALEEKGLYRDKKPHQYRVGVCSRTGDIIEPYLKPQWFVDCSEIAEQAREALVKGELRIIPDNHHHTWHHWLGNIKPWCISRQLWWGHRIPAYYATTKQEEAAAVTIKIGADEDPSRWFVGRTEEEALKRAAESLKVAESEIVLRRDEDVLDTWFSAGLHPFYTIGWPHEETSQDYRTFFPTQLMETGHDILFFWVARMVMLSLALTGKLPFRDVYLHAMVRDKEGKKMSKSSGNVIDPLDVLEGITLEGLHAKLKGGNLDPREVERAVRGQKEQFPKGIEQCGSDALRFGLLSYTVSGKNVNMDVDRIVAYRHFCNKLWQAVRYGLFFALGADYQPPSRTIAAAELAAAPFACRWILSCLDRAVTDVNAAFASYEFSTATTVAYSFWLYEFCDVFLELTKPVIKLEATDPRRRVTLHVLWVSMEVGLRLLHPMMPFVTEELWNRLPGGRRNGGTAENRHPTESIMVAEYPQGPLGYRSEQVEQEMKQVQHVVHAARSLKSSLSMTVKHRPPVYLQSADPSASAVYRNQAADIECLAVTGPVTVVAAKEEVPSGCVANVVDHLVTLHLGVEGMVDVEKELQRLGKNRGKVEQSREGLVKKTQMANYEAKVPEDVRRQNAEKLVQLQQELEAIDQALAALRQLKEGPKP
eukprot:TRINITY_DN253_c1_g1_i3.p1 TRINITY_DN253_c1_g1~~TRINITY_DN253_c1_g1_i3.p1  ORF type:complete len:1003 (+),score=254.75 TRINITY_DN253_c1_g1_i3:934-3942(+)